MNRTLVLEFAFLFVCLVFSLNELGSVSFATANPNESFPQLAMPIEHVNYTIVSENSSLWAKIDGDYPISILNRPDCTFKVDLPMVYPMPPGATNIHIYLDDRELSWENYSSSYPDSLHHTAIGDWEMIYCLLNDVSNEFTLQIHYEHPLQVMNGSYLFLYDLNIGSYLSEASNNSTCYYTIRIETNFTNIHAYTTQTDTRWNPINFTTEQAGKEQVISVQEFSEFNKPLPGDLVFEFSTANPVPEITPLALSALFLPIIVFSLVFFSRKSLSKNSIKK